MIKVYYKDIYNDWAEYYGSWNMAGVDPTTVDGIEYMLRQSYISYHPTEYLSSLEWKIIRGGEERIITLCNDEDMMAHKLAGDT